MRPIAASPQMPLLALFLRLARRHVCPVFSASRWWNAQQAKRGFRVSGIFGKLSAAAAFVLLIISPASAETAAETAKQWGLIGMWSQDCALPPDHNKGTLLSYEIAGDRVVHRRDFGDSRDEAEVLSLRTSADGMINLRVYFPSVRQTREYGMIHEGDNTLRAIYNRNEKNQYSIKDGKFTADGKPTPVQHKCERPGA